jgi:hypothetical protein
VYLNSRVLSLEPAKKKSFGLAITGIQRPDDDDDCDEPEELRHYLDCGDTDEFALDRQAWLDDTAGLWKINEDIPYGSHCLLEGAIVDVDVGDAKPVYIRQYKLPENQLEVLRKWRDKMLQCKVIELAEDGCQWNNPLNVQDKKDPTGRKGNEFRPCLDARELNKLLVNSMKGEIPFIEEMHAFVNGNVVHSSWDYWKRRNHRSIVACERAKSVCNRRDLLAELGIG